MRSLTCWTFAVLTCLAGTARGAGLEIRRAYPVSNEPWEDLAKDASIGFGPFTDIDWKGLAGTRFSEYPLEGPFDAHIAALAARVNMFWNVESHYSAPTPKAEADARLLFLSARGSRRLMVTGLVGTVRYRLSRDHDRVEQVTHWGDVIGRQDPDTLPEGGFVVRPGDGQGLLSETVQDPVSSPLELDRPFPKLGVVRQVE